jgi:hypothetical protein
MRIIGEIPHPGCKITLFNWNNRYIIKVESGYLEQTFKVDQFELGSDEDLKRLVSEAFINETLDRFTSMSDSLARALK